MPLLARRSLAVASALAGSFLGALCASLIVAGTSASANMISAGGARSCAARAGQVLCAGLDYSTNQGSKVLVPVSGISNATQVSVGRAACAVLNSGRVDCWGDGNFGKLGNGSTEDSATPVAVTGINNAVSVTVGKFHACAVLWSGSVKCWGLNFNGALGNGSSIAFSSVPVEVAGINNALAVSTKDHFDETCALLSTGGVDCWGAGGAGQLGNGATHNSPVPVAVSGVHNAVGIAAGGSHACAVLVLGRLVCWGDGELTPHPVSISPVAGVSVALGEICAVLINGEARCWGANKRGQNGFGRVGRETERPHVVQGIHDAVSISAAVFHNCVQLASGGADCWGYNDYGDLGANLPPGVYPTPQPVVFPPLSKAGAEPTPQASPTPAGKPDRSGPAATKAEPPTEPLPGDLGEHGDRLEQPTQDLPLPTYPEGPNCESRGPLHCAGDQVADPNTTR
jgi:alpha-tubulin suppressor-like RCC1 family protein